MQRTLGLWDTLRKRAYQVSKSGSDIFWIMRTSSITKMNTKQARAISPAAYPFMPRCSKRDKSAIAIASV